MIQSPCSPPPTRLAGWDLAGVILSSACLVHCTLLPLLLVMLPFLGFHYVADEKVHHLITALVVPVAMVALIPGYRRHRRTRVLLLGGLGLCLMASGPFLHETMGETLEQYVAALGGVFLVTAHLNNRRLSGPCCARPAAAPRR